VGATVIQPAAAPYAKLRSYTDDLLEYSSSTCGWFSFEVHFFPAASLSVKLGDLPRTPWHSPHRDRDRSSHLLQKSLRPARKKGIISLYAKRSRTRSRLIRGTTAHRLSGSVPVGFLHNGLDACAPPGPRKTFFSGRMFALRNVGRHLTERHIRQSLSWLPSGSIRGHRPCSPPIA